MLELDTPVMSPGLSRLRYSYGPRVEVDGTVICPENVEGATFWAVYKHGIHEEAVHVEDVPSQDKAKELAEKLNKEVDPLTLAYIGRGAGAVCDSVAGPAFAKQGELDGIAEILRFAADLDSLSDEFSEEADGCFCYDVVEPFGRWAAEELASAQKIDKYSAWLTICGLLSAWVGIKALPERTQWMMLPQDHVAREFAMP